MQVIVELPDQIARQWGGTPDAVQLHMLEAVALERYRAGQISRGQVSQMLKLSFSDTEAFLKENGAYLHYSLSDLEADRATLDKILKDR
jgi:hypothetical protein